MAVNCRSVLSFGEKCDYIDPLLCSLLYASVEDAAAFILRAGQGAVLAKLEVRLQKYPGSFGKSASAGYAVAG